VAIQIDGPLLEFFASSSLFAVFLTCLCCDENYFLQLDVLWGVGHIAVSKLRRICTMLLSCPFVLA
jgi:hypothetical protein